MAGTVGWLRRIFRRMAGSLAEFSDDVALHSRGKRQSCAYRGGRSGGLRGQVRAGPGLRTELLGIGATGSVFPAGGWRRNSEALRAAVENLARQPDAD